MRTEKDVMKEMKALLVELEKMYDETPEVVRRTQIEDKYNITINFDVMDVPAASSYSGVSHLEMLRLVLTLPDAKKLLTPEKYVDDEMGGFDD